MKISKTHKFKRYIYLYFIYFLTTQLNLIGCSPNQDKSLSGTDHDIKWIGKKIVFPNSLNMPLRKDTNLTEILKNNRDKIVVYFNTDCSVCSLELGEWQKFIEKQNKDIIDYIFIASGNSKEYMEYIVYDKIDFRPPIFFDFRNDFFNTNNLPNDKFYHSMLLNKKNEIVLLGSPVTNDIIRKSYNEYLKSK